MELKSEVVSILDLLDLDEEIVDKRLRVIMCKSTFTNKTLVNAIHLLQYKLLINSQDEIDCENHEEFNFVVKLLSTLGEDNVDSCCTILNLTLRLNNTTLLQKSEHLLQQILNNVGTGLLKCSNETEGVDNGIMLQVYFYLKICDAILDTVSNEKMQLTLPFLDTPLDHLLSFDNKVKVHFLVNTVPKLFHVVKGYSILDKIWTFINESNDMEVTLNVLSCLSNFFLPTVDKNGQLSLESEIVFKYTFWDKIRQGLMSEKDSLRKTAIYLAKRSIDYLVSTNKEVKIDNENLKFVWSSKRKYDLKNVWENFFILIESLEEKQSNIVLPSLQLFDKVKELGVSWLNCAFKVGLKHDNTLVKFKTIDYRLQEKISTQEEAITFLEALNDINICDLFDQLNKKILAKLQVFSTLILFLRTIPQINWSPTPLYCLSNILVDVYIEADSLDCESFPEIVQNICKIPCTNVIVRKAVEVNMTYLIGNSFKNLKWKQYLDVYSSLKYDYNKDHKNPLMMNIKSLKLNELEKEMLFSNIYTKKHLSFILIYIENNIEDINIFRGVVEKRIRNINNIVSRQYSDKRECLDDVKFLIYIYCRSNTEFLKHIHELIKTEVSSILKYIASLVSSEKQLGIEDCQHICTELDTLLEDREDLITSMLDLYKSCIIILKHGHTRFLILPVMVVNKLTSNKFLNTSYRHEMATVKTILEILSAFNPREPYKSDDSGRLNNVLFEQCSNVVQKLVDKDQHPDIDLLVQFIDNVLDCGGYGCLKWILMIVDKQLPAFLTKDKEFDIIKFLNTAWIEIEELKSSNEYSLTMESFIDLLLNQNLINKSAYNNIILLYCCKILEYGYLKSKPLYYLIKKLDVMDITQACGHLVYAFSEVLLFSPIIRKDQRINANVELEILSNPRFFQFVNVNDTCFNYQLQYKTVSVLTKIKDETCLTVIANIIMNKIDSTLKNKQRYHGNSLVHKILQIGLQHLLTIILIERKAIDIDAILNWSLFLIAKTPHQPSVRIFLEWIIALYIIFQNFTLSDKLYHDLRMKYIPITSQFFIIYWVAKYKIQNNCIQNEEFEFVLDKLLANTMGQMFNLRLNTQYLAKNLYDLNKDKATKYDYIIQVIENTFKESEKDKNFEKLKADFFANHFNVIEHFTPCFIYYFLPRYCDQSNMENVDINYIRTASDEINSNINENEEKKENYILNNTISTDEVLRLQFRRITDESAKEKDESSGTLQKKYIPWKHMTEADMFQDTKKKTSNSELILVASLIDKLPNLGGMARTSEVFGVKTYVVDSVRHLQDKVFQGLSVSAERWVDIEQVRPGAPLKEYLLRKKSEGYSLVAAEQTSSSGKLQNFKFPKKSVLLLGHEKDGVPCDILPLMDHCVEIPQQGFVRSLNVHVTAAIFVWEYTRQHLL